jgi:ABC-type bacteriocin/lantibiotic exporter with double-glycine peptidase domain
MSIGTIHAFVSYITFMLWPIQEMARVYAEMQQAIASGERIFSLIDAVPEIQDQTGADDPGTIRGDIVFDKVNFQYEEGKPVLKDFSLTIKQGETIALVGPTGAGKSTIVNLVCRFYEPTSGQILINGRNYRDLTLHAIHSRIGMVLQTPPRSLVLGFTMRMFRVTINERRVLARLSQADGTAYSEADLSSVLEAARFVCEGDTVWRVAECDLGFLSEDEVVSCEEVF